MKIKHLYIALFALMAMASCTKEADMNMAEEKNLAPAKNAYRATLIEGHNDIWGDYIFRINYENDRLKNAVRVTKVILLVRLYQAARRTSNIHTRSETLSQS